MTAGPVTSTVRSFIPLFSNKDNERVMIDINSSSGMMGQYNR